MNDQLDLITSNGLNSYEPDTGRVIDLYRSFYDALRLGGVLIISFAPPPQPKPSWQNHELQNFLIEQAIFSDILRAKWQNYRTEDQMRQHLTKAGFTHIDIVYDTQRVILNTVAKKI